MIVGIQFGGFFKHVVLLLYCHLLIHAEIYIYIYWIHTDAMIKTLEDFFNKIFVPLTFLQGFEKGYSRFACERVLETEQNWNILTPNLWLATLCLSRSPDAQPEVQRPTLLGDGFLYCILSATSLVPKLHRGSLGPPRPDVAFSTTSRLTPPPTVCN